MLSYATIIRFLGNADFVRNISNEKNLVLDEYKANGKKIEVYYSLGEKSRINAPRVIARLLICMETKSKPAKSLLSPIL